MVLAAVRSHGLALRHAAAVLRQDREVVLAAVSQDGRALKYADEAFRSDRRVALAAVTGDRLPFPLVCSAAPLKYL